MVKALFIITIKNLLYMVLLIHNKQTRAIFK